MAAARRLSAWPVSCCQAARAMSSAEASIAVAMSARLVLGHGIVGERAVAELAGGGEGQRLVERAAGEAKRGGADRHPEQVQRLHRDLEAVARRADQLGRGRRRT